MSNFSKEIFDALEDIRGKAKSNQDLEDQEVAVLFLASLLEEEG